MSKTMKSSDSFWNNAAAALTRVIVWQGGCWNVTSNSQWMLYYGNYLLLCYHHKCGRVNISFNPAAENLTLISTSQQCCEKSQLLDRKPIFKIEAKKISPLFHPQILSSSSSSFSLMLLEFPIYFTDIDKWKSHLKNATAAAFPSKWNFSLVKVCYGYWIKKSRYFTCRAEKSYCHSSAEWPDMKPHLKPNFKP